MFIPLPAAARRNAGPIVLIACLLLGAFACSSGTTQRKRPVIIDDPALQNAMIEKDVAALHRHVEAYFARYGELPYRLPDLRETPDGVAMIDDIPLDPWAVPYLLRRLDNDIVIYSTGEDLLIGTADDQGLRVSFDGVDPTTLTPANTPAAAAPKADDAPTPDADTGAL